MTAPTPNSEGPGAPRVVTVAELEAEAVASLAAFRAVAHAQTDAFFDARLEDLRRQFVTMRADLAAQRDDPGS